MPKDQFPATSWSLIKRAGRPLTPEGRAALAVLCKDYWFPVYAFCRRWTGSAEKASDRTQGFFSRLLEKNDLAKVDDKYGSRFRSWLLGCVKHYNLNMDQHEKTGANGGGQVIESLEAADAEGRYRAEPSHGLTPERLYERHFARALLDRVLVRVHERYVAAGREALFEALKGSLTQEAAQQPHEQVAAAFGMTEAAVKKAAFDLRARYKKALRAEVATLLGQPPDKDPPPDEADVNAELRELLAALED